MSKPVLYLFNGKVARFGNAVFGFTPDPYNPLGLPPNTVRVRTSDGKVPDKAIKASYDTATLVAGTSDVYDVYKSGTSFENLLNYSTNVVEILGANTTGITNMSFMLYNCSFSSVPLFDTTSVTNMSWMLGYNSSLTTVPLYDTSKVTDISGMFGYDTALKSVPLFDTSKATNMSWMFYGCTAFTTVPLLNTSSVTNMNNMFFNCTKVESGALALYQQASSQTTPPSSHSYAFYRCGSGTTTGAAELSQIPSGWK